MIRYTGVFFPLYRLHNVLIAKKKVAVGITRAFGGLFGREAKFSGTENYAVYSFFYFAS